jgi:hypothetical protein
MLKDIKKLIMVMIFAAVFLSVMTIARMLGGAHASQASEYSLRAMGLLSTLGITVVVLKASVNSLDWLNFFELIKLARGLIYVLLSTGSSLSLVTDHGKKAVALLKLKGYRMNTFPLKLGAYIRIVAPTFSVLLQDMNTQANSLYYRGFLEKPLYRMEFEAVLKGNQLLWIIATVCTFLIGVSLKLWM